MSKRRWLQFVLGLLWLCLGLSSVVFWWFSDIRVDEVPQLLADWVDETGIVACVGLFLLVYLVRPLVLFPSTVMGVASGMAFGPVFGSVVTMIGEVAGAGVAFSLARLFGRRWIRTHESERLARWDRKVSQNGLASVCIMRLILLPFDSVSYLCGLTGIRLYQFLLGTLFGASFFVLGVTLLGGSASVELDGEVELWGYTLANRHLVLGMSILSLVLGLVIAWCLRKRYKNVELNAAPNDTAETS